MKEGYKETKIGIIPNDWICQDLGNIIKLGNGKDYKHLKTGDIPVYGTGGIITYVDDFLYEGKTIGIGRKGSIDKPVLLQGKFWTVDTLFYIKEFINSDVDFVYNLFLKIPWLLYNEATGLPSLSQQIIKKIKVPLPPLKEQKAIADCLSTWDKTIELQSKLIISKELRNKALSKQFLSGKRRLNGYVISHDFVKTDLGLEVPADWKIMPLKNILTERKEKSKDQLKFPLYSLTIERGLTEKTARYERSFLLKDIENNEYRIVYPRDILFNPMNLRFGAICKSNLDSIVSVSAYYNVMFLSNEKFNLVFLEALFKSKRFIHLYERIAIGSLEEKKRVHLTNFFELNIPVPSIEEQNAIANVLETANKELQLEKQKLANFQQQKKALMQQLLTGKVRLV